MLFQCWVFYNVKFSLILPKFIDFPIECFPVNVAFGSILWQQFYSVYFNLLGFFFNFWESHLCGRESSLHLKKVLNPLLNHRHRHCHHHCLGIVVLLMLMAVFFRQFSIFHNIFKYIFGPISILSSIKSCCAFIKCSGTRRAQLSYLTQSHYFWQKVKRIFCSSRLSSQIYRCCIKCKINCCPTFYLFTLLFFFRWWFVQYLISYFLRASIFQLPFFRLIVNLLEND